MARVSPLTLAPLLLLAACGLGLQPLTGDDVDAGPDADLGDQVTVSLAGRTYAADLADVEVLEPAGLDPLLHEAVDGTLLFHVTDEEADRVGLAMTLGDADGRQDTCTPVYDLPAADWTGNPALAIDDGAAEIDIAEQPVSLSKLSMVTLVTPDATEWENTHLRALVDTRDLQGGSLAEGTDVCGLVEDLGGECRHCDDGAQVCAVIELTMDLYEVDTAFDMDAGGC